MRVGNIVHASGELSVEPTLNNTLTSVSLQVPIPSAFVDTFNAAGTLWGLGVADSGGEILADIITANQVVLNFTSSGTTAQLLRFIYTYEIKP